MHVNCGTNISWPTVNTQIKASTQILRFGVVHVYRMHAAISILAYRSVGGIYHYASENVY